MAVAKPMPELAPVISARLGESVARAQELNQGRRPWRPWWTVDETGGLKNLEETYVESIEIEHSKYEIKNDSGCEMF
jgi:hypothetical protein